MRKPMPQMVDRICKGCKHPFKARAADVKRGWGLFCSKSCKAIKQEQRTGQFAAHKEATSHLGDNPYFTDAHLFSNEDHDCSKSDD